jgi:hypothetical protein
VKASAALLSGSWHGPQYQHTAISRWRAFLLNAAFVAGLLVLSQLPVLESRPVVRASIVGAAVVLLAWSALLFGILRRGQDVTLDVLPRRSTICRHASRAGASLLGLLLARGLSRRTVDRRATALRVRVRQPAVVDAPAHFLLGFGPFPIVFSITLFFWFKDPWFYWQFAMVALGLAAKEFLRWKRDGVNTHIFNPSSFPLAVSDWCC